MNEKRETPAAKLIVAISSYTPKKTNWMPDWKNSDSYNIDPDKATSSQWAWEFLRRNREFQRYCDQPSSQVDDSADSWVWRPCWGLAKFKHYSSDYVPAKVLKGPGPSQSPEWSITQPVRIIDRTTGPLSQKGVHNLSLDLDEGQVAVVFDLNAGLYSPKLLDKQFVVVQEKLNAALARFSKRKSVVGANTHWEKNLLTYLRVVDAITCKEKVRRADIGRKLYEEKLILNGRFDPSDIELSRAIQPHIKAAWNLIYEGGYLRLLAK